MKRHGFDSVHESRLLDEYAVFSDKHILRYSDTEKYSDTSVT